MKYIEGAPIVAVEVRSDRDYGLAKDQEIAAKRERYFAAGTQVVWDVDLKAEKIQVYRHDQPDQPKVYHRGEIANADPALPGWELPVDLLFPDYQSTMQRD